MPARAYGATAAAASPGDTPVKRFAPVSSLWTIAAVTLEAMREIIVPRLLR